MRIRLSALLAGLLVFFTPLSGVGQSSVATLNQELQTAVAAKNWDEAIKVIDQMIPIAPGQATQLTRYRSELLQLQKLRPSPGGTNPLTPSQNTRRGEVPIKRRSAGVPVVDVTFNGRRSFEMLVDSGASLTVITRPMAKALGITTDQIVETRTFSTANGKTQMPIVYVNSIEVGGLVVKRVQVAIAGPDMDIGLLGQDFLERHDVVIKQKQIHFKPRG